MLVFTYLGFNTEELAVGNNPTMNVSLSQSDRKMDEVVVIGYGTQSRRTLTGAVSTVDPKVLESVPRTNAATALQGTVSGLRVQQNTGRTGRNAYYSVSWGYRFQRHRFSVIYCRWNYRSFFIWYQLGRY